MKRMVAFLLVCCFAFVFASCSENTRENKGDAAATTTDQQAPGTGDTADATVENSEGAAGPDAEISDDPKLGERYSGMDEMHLMSRFYCNARYNGDAQTIMGMLHPQVLEVVRDTIPATMEAEPLLECTYANNEEIECKDSIREMGQELGLDIQACGRVMITIVVGTEENSTQKDLTMLTEKVDGKWYMAEWL